MKILPARYECEICKWIYTKQEEAEECERKGNGPVYPVGMIYSGGHKDITFAVAEIVLEKHSNDSGSWACRDNGYGDSLGKDLCGGQYLDFNEYHSKIDFNHPTFKRMVAYLTKENIPITIWNGKEAVPYKAG